MARGRPRTYIPDIDRPDLNKVCKDCEEVFPQTQEFFYHSKLTKDKFNIYCRKCHYARTLASKRRNPEQNRAKVEAWRMANLRKAADRKARYRAKLLRTSYDFSSDVWLLMLDFYEGVCVYCPNLATAQDHIVAISRGGDHKPDNIVPCCKPCNSSKSDRSLEEFVGLERSTRIIERHADFLALMLRS